MSIKMSVKMTGKMIPKTFYQHFPSWRRVCIVPIIYVYLCIVPTYLTFVVITTYTKFCVFQNVTAGSQSTSTTHFSCRRNIVGRLCIRPTIVFLILSNQKARVRSLTSRRPFLCTYNMYYYKQLSL